jgi:hypothetical protein
MSVIAGLPHSTVEKRYEQESRHQEGRQERTRQDDEGKEGSKESEEGSIKASMMCP